MRQQAANSDFTLLEFKSEIFNLLTQNVRRIHSGYLIADHLTQIVIIDDHNHFPMYSPLLPSSNLRTPIAAISAGNYSEKARTMSR